MTDQKFNVGDAVRIKKGVKRYVLTRPGSIGQVTHVNNSHDVCVEFYTLTGYEFHDCETYEFPIGIDTIEHIDLTDPEIRLLIVKAKLERAK